MLLEIEGLDVRYGRNHAVKALDLTVGEGEIVTVLGANGAGKSSLLKAVQGTVKPAGGSVRPFPHPAMVTPASRAAQRRRSRSMGACMGRTSWWR